MPTTNGTQPETGLNRPAVSLRLPSLDGWRAMSICLVLVAHSRLVPNCPRWMETLSVIVGPEVGVRFFFVISGLLITWLMIGEQAANGDFSLRHFYIRRALRILPVYFVFLAVLGCLQWLTPFAQSRGNWLANLTFTTNYVPSSWTSGHLWSLAVEEQFYLLWPVLFVLGNLGANHRRAVRVLVVPLLIAPIFRALTFKHIHPPGLAPLFSVFSFFNHFDCLAVGCLCAFLLAHNRKKIEGCLSTFSGTALGAGLALVILPYFLGSLGIPGRIVVAVFSTMQSAGFALLLLQSILAPRAAFYPLLNLKWIRHLGVLSYSIYIWQQIFCTQPSVFGLQPVWWLSFPGWLVSTLVVAHLSYFLVERPFLTLRSRFRSQASRSRI